MARPKAKRPVAVAIIAQPPTNPTQWVAFVPVGPGKPRRKRSAAMCANCRVAPNRECECWERCADKVRDLEDKVAAGPVSKAGRMVSVEAWFTIWLTDIAPHQRNKRTRRPLAPMTLAGYWSKARRWIFPHIGGIALDRLEIEDLDGLYARMYDAGMSAGYVAGVHAVIRRALRVAVQRKRIPYNIAAEMDNPGSLAQGATHALTDAETDRIIAAIEAREDALRWKLGLSVGPRQGETLGIRWAYVDLEQGVLDKSWQIQRLPWKHGCADPAACGKHVVATACTGGPKHDRYHRHGCPEPRGKVCARGCAKHADQCPDRHGGGIVFTRPKTFTEAGGEHLVALPRSLVAQLREHHTAQAALRLRVGGCPAGQACRVTGCPRWHDFDLVLCQNNGRPVEPRKDYDRWQRIQREVGAVRPCEGCRRSSHVDGHLVTVGGTHVLRASAATALLDAGEDIAVVQEVLGHSNIRTTRGYAKVSVRRTRRAADLMDRRLFGAATDSESSATDLATERLKRRSGTAS